MKQIKKYDEEKEELVIECECGELINYDLSTISEIKFIEEFNEYENLHIPCTTCQRIHVINSNIELSEYEERIYEEFYCDFFVINKRKIIRDILWKKRADLKNLNRDKYNESKKHLYYEAEEEYQNLLRRNEAMQ